MILLVYLDFVRRDLISFTMSLQDGAVENTAEPTRKNDDAAELAVGAGTRLDIMKSWIKTCNEHHGSPCVIPKADATVWPAWLIDVVDACIVEGDVAERYLTLSYVWGGVQTLQLTTNNINRLRQQGSLTKEEVTLPKTIREALEVTRLLEERYIFVDQLCIVQDDQQHKTAEIEHMAEIYFNAYLTLVATTGWTADCGLADNIEQWIYKCPVWKKPVSANHTYQVREATESSEIQWSTRGW